MKSIGAFLRNLRAKKEAADSTRESVERGRREAEIVARAELLKAALAVADRLGDPEQIKKLVESALVVDSELQEMNSVNAAQIARVKALVETTRGEN